jgi:hypothetical protein
MACPFTKLFERSTAFCPKASELTQKEVYFVFEGAGGYAPYQSEAIRQNLYTQFAKNEDFQSACQVSCDPKKCQEVGEKIYRKNEWLAFPFALKHIIQKNLIGKEWFYFSQKHENEAQACLEKLSKDTNLSFKTLGYSMGGYAAVLLSEFAEEKNLPLRAGFSLDPVGQGVGLLTSITGQRNMRRMQEHRFRIHWINFFQKQDTKSMGVGIKGNSLPYADLNHEVIDFNGNEERGHILISLKPKVQEEIREFIKY